MKFRQSGYAAKLKESVIKQQVRIATKPKARRIKKEPDDENFIVSESDEDSARREHRVKRRPGRPLKVPIPTVR